MTNATDRRGAAARPSPMPAAAALAWCSAGALAYTFVGYPALAAVRARLAPRPVRRGSGAEPTVSVVVPAHDEADVIEAKLENTLALDYPPGRLDVVVVDDGSGDATAALAARFEARGVRLLRQPERRGKAAAVNAGVAAARGDLVLLTDASAMLAAGALRSAVSWFADPGVAVVSGAIRLLDADSPVVRPAGLYWRYQEALRRWESATGSTVGVNGNLFVFRRAAFRPLDPTTVNDEFTIAVGLAAAGGRVLYDPGAVTWDHASSTTGEEFARRSRINAGRVQSASRGLAGAWRQPSLAFRLLSHKLARTAAPFALLTLLVASAVRAGASLRQPRRRASVAALEGWPAGVVLGAQVVLYGAAAAAWSAERSGRRVPAPLRVPLFFVSSNAAALVGSVRAVRRRQTTLWRKRAAVPVLPAGSGPSGPGVPGRATPAAERTGARPVLVVAAAPGGGSRA